MTTTIHKPKESPGFGTLFILIIFALLVFGAMQFTGGSPISHTPSGTLVVTITPIVPEPTKNNLQLYTFGGATPVNPPASITPIAGTIPGKIVNLNPTGKQDTNPTGKPDTGKPGGSTPECGIANPVLRVSKNSGGECCVMDGPVNDISQCCPGVPSCKDIMDNPAKYNSGTTQYACSMTDTKAAALWCDAKPVIYLYPTVKTTVNVTLQVPGTIPVSDPLYPEDGWQNIVAYPDGTFNYQGKTYHELFYEASITPIDPPDNGIISTKNDLKITLTNITTQLGLNQNEQKEFLDYWLPKLTELNSPYILISVFDPRQKDIIDHVDITPKPDTFIQFIMYYKALNNYINIPPLPLPDMPPKRKGFTAVEWGGIIDH